MIVEVEGADRGADLGVDPNEGTGEHDVFDAGVGEEDAVAHDGIDHFGSFLHRDVQPDDGVGNPGAAPLIDRDVFT